MKKPKARAKGDIFLPTVAVLKEKNGTPAKILMNGQIYALVHQDSFNGNKNKVKKDI